MIKNTIIALVAAVSMVGVAAPAFAQSGGAFGDGSPESRQFTADNILANLRSQGVNASSVEEWGSLIRAFVTYSDGSRGMEFFAPGTLQPVTP